jgi:asparagine synthase (glutamine-hydrolysing)
MCGIAGLIGESSHSTATELLRKINHRGPDGTGVWVSPPHETQVTLCHTRLSILDLSDSGNQPYVSHDGRFILVFNGEIYNFIELKNALASKYNAHFFSDSDTEVLLNGLILEGIKFLDKCNGMWAFCLWDRYESKATLCRDRFGIKPLYFSELSCGRLGFSSEMKGLSPLLTSISPSDHIGAFFANPFSYESTDMCVIDKIKRLPAGYCAVYKDNLLTISQWWNTLDNLVEVPSEYSSQTEEWQSLFFNSVNLRMRSDVRIGTALSGGLDSSSVLAAMSAVSKQSGDLLPRSSDDWRHAICCSYPGSSLDEVHYAEEVAASCGVAFNTVSLTPDLSPSNIFNALAQVEDPYLTLPLPMLETYKAIKSNNISVTLDGHGADELFSGYGHLNFALRSASSMRQFLEIIQIEQSTRSGVFSAVEQKSVLKKLKYRAYYFLASVGVLPLATLKYLLASWKTMHFSSDVSSQMAQKLRTLNNHARFREMDVFSQVLYEIFHLTILPTLLRNYDRYSMASGLEIRMPFMDWRLVSYTFSLPWQAKLGGTYTKRIQRDALSGFLCDSVRLRRDKIGWNAPVHEWFNGPLKPFVEDQLSLGNSTSYFTQFKSAWENFSRLRNPNFHDGQKLWNASLPHFWLCSLNSSTWK